MSHLPVIFSEPGTPLLDRTVGELVAERPGRSRIFQKHHIDFCCQGGTTLREACERKGLSANAIAGEIEEETSKEPESGFNPALLEPDRLSAYIVEKHHGYLRQELPRLHAMSQRVARVHGGHTPSLVEVFRVFGDLTGELLSHMMKEEEILFPALEKMSRGESAAGSLEGPILGMMQEHDEAGAALVKLRELTNGFQPPPQACNTYRALFAGLQDLETDLHQHIHLENTVLFPAARKLAAG